MQIFFAFMYSNKIEAMTIHIFNVVHDFESSFTLVLKSVDEFKPGHLYSFAKACNLFETSCFYFLLFLEMTDCTE